MLRPTADELWNPITHGIGLLLSVVGAAAMIGGTLDHQDPWRWAGCTVYATALVGVYACSTLSHSASEPSWKRFFRVLDQAFIYLLIVGTYTPFALAYLRTGWWLLFLGGLWTLALAGFLSKILMAHRVDAVVVWLYVLLGWMPIISAVPLREIVPSSVLWWM
ncbi:MAG: hemolysin III family protein, partial [Pirellulaceae bacterium]